MVARKHRQCLTVGAIVGDTVGRRVGAFVGTVVGTVVGTGIGVGALVPGYGGHITSRGYIYITA